MPKMSDYLVYNFNKFVFISYYSLHFKEFFIVIICKPGGTKDYTCSESYWCINLFNILRKIIETVLVTEINYIVTTYHLLLKMYIVIYYG